MKCSLLMIVAIFLPLGACADAGESMTEATISQEIPEDVQELLAVLHGQEKLQILLLQ